MTIPGGGGEAVPFSGLDGPKYAPIAPNAPFILVHHAGYPGSWRIETEGLQGPTWLPQVDRFILSPGVNGVGTIEPGQDPSEAYTATREILHKAKIVEVKAPGVVVSEPCRDPRSGATGQHYRERFERVEAPANPAASAKVRIDRAERNRWRAQLVADGLIPAPHESIIFAARRDLVSALERARGRTDVAPDVRDAQIAAADHALSVFDGARKPWIPEEPKAKKVSA